MGRQEFTDKQKDLELLIPDSVLSTKVYNVNNRTVTDISSVDLTDTGWEQMKELHTNMYWEYTFYRWKFPYLY